MASRTPAIAKRKRPSPAATKKPKAAAAKPNKYFELRRSSIQGRGAFATRPIKKGTRIIEYVGERISHTEADKRYDDTGMGRHHTFLFSVGRSTVIDAAVGGNDARFINHSCAPNCEAIDERKRIYIDLETNGQCRRRIDLLNRLVHAQNAGPQLFVAECVVAEDRLAIQGRSTAVIVGRRNVQHERRREKVSQYTRADQSHRGMLLSLYTLQSANAAKRDIAKLVRHVAVVSGVRE